MVSFCTAKLRPPPLSSLANAVPVMLKVFVTSLPAAKGKGAEYTELPIGGDAPGLLPRDS